MAKLLDYMMELATNQKVRDEHNSVEKMTGVQKKEKEHEICQKYGLTSSDWQLLTTQYQTREEANEAISKRLSQDYPGIKVETELCGGPTCMRVVSVRLPR